MCTEYAKMFSRRSPHQKQNRMSIRLWKNGADLFPSFARPKPYETFMMNGVGHVNASIWMFWRSEFHMHRKVIWIRSERS